MLNGGRLVAAGRTWSFQGGLDLPELALEIRETEEALCVRLVPRRAIALERVELDLAIPAGARYFKHGFQSWSPSIEIGGTERFRRPWLPVLSLHYEDPGFPLKGIPYQEKGHFLAYWRTNDRFLLLLPRDLPQVIPHFLFRPEQVTVLLEVGKEIDRPTLLLDMVIRLSVSLPLPRPTSPRQFGWSSWYYYYSHLRPQDVLDNLAMVDKFPYPLTYFQIDDAWQEAVGDWQEKDSYRGRLAQLARRIQDQGLVPGIWLAPFVAEKKARIRRQREWFLRDEAGNPKIAGYNPGWSGPFYALDPSHPQVQAYLSERMEWLRSLGFGLFKFDFLYSLAIAGRNRAGWNRKEQIDFGLGFLRKMAGDTQIIGCGMPLVSRPCFDFVRVGPDVAPRWEDRFLKLIGFEGRVEAFNALRNTLSRSFLDGVYWQNDPDVMILRKCKLLPCQQRTLILADWFLSRFLFYSDPLDRVPAETLALLGQLGRFLDFHLLECGWTDGAFTFGGRTSQEEVLGWINLSAVGKPLVPPPDWSEFAPVCRGDGLPSYSTRVFHRMAPA